jgi:hypothetical protein
MRAPCYVASEGTVAAAPRRGDVRSRPDVDEWKPHDASPTRLIDRIEIPVRLIYGAENDSVPIAQSRVMKKALDAAGLPTASSSSSGTLIARLHSTRGSSHLQ